MLRRRERPHQRARADDQVVKIWDVEKRTLDRERRGCGDSVFDVAFSPDGTLLATSPRDVSARIRDLDGRELAVLGGHTGPLWDASFSADRRRLVTASFDRSVRTWIFDSDELLELASAHLDRLGRDSAPEEFVRSGDLVRR